MAKGKWRLVWRGDQVVKDAEAALSKGLTEIGLQVEGEAKKELFKGHGVLTGTLRRSIHIATPGYDWAGDNAKPSASSPELGGMEAVPAKQNGRLTVQVGSGMEYALPVHQGHGSFSGYHFLTKAVEKVKPRMLDILKKHGAVFTQPSRAGKRR